VVIIAADSPLTSTWHVGGGGWRGPSDQLGPFLCVPSMINSLGVEVPLPNLMFFAAQSTSPQSECLLS